MDKIEKVNAVLNDESAREIARAITEAGEEISRTIASLSLNFSTEMAIAVTIIGALSASVTAFFFNLIHERIAQKRSRLIRLASLLDKLVLELETLSTKYWSTDFVVGAAPEFLIAETQIKSLLKYINANIKILSGCRSKVGRTDQDDRLGDFCLEIFDVITGDGFESITRKASREKVVRISSKCIEVRTELSKLVAI